MPEIIAERIDQCRFTAGELLLQLADNGQLVLIQAENLLARGLLFLADPTKARAISAGTAPGERVHPEVADVMNEVGVDVSKNRPTFLSMELAQSATLLITMGCGDACPAVPGLRRDDWPLEDPKGKPPERVRAIRDEIRARVTALIDAEGWRS